MVDYTGVVSKRGGIKSYEYGNKFFMELSDMNGRPLVDENGVPVKMMVEVTDHTHPRNQVTVGDVVHVTCRRGKSSGDTVWCGVTLNQTFDILEHTQPTNVVEITGRVTARGRIKLYGPVPKFFVVITEPNGKENKVMIEVPSARVDQYTGDVETSDPVNDVGHGDTIRVRCYNPDAEQSGWCNVRGADVEIVSSCSVEQKTAEREAWIASKRRERDEAKSAEASARKSEHDKVASWFKRYTGSTGRAPSGYAIDLGMQVLDDLVGVKPGSGITMGSGGIRSLGVGGWEKPSGLRARALHNKPESHRNAAMNVILTTGWVKMFTKDGIEYYQITDDGREALRQYRNWIDAQSEE